MFKRFSVVLLLLAVLSGCGGVAATAASPTISSVSPSSDQAGSTSFTLTVSGAKFNGQCVVQWNGSQRATTMVDSNHLHASISSADVASAGTASVTVKNTHSGVTSNAVTFTITSTTTTIATLAITTSSLPNGTVGAAYSTTLAASGGSTPYTWSIASGTLPSGLTLSSSGTLSGTPTAAGSFTFTVKVKDAESTPQTATKSFTVSIASSTTALAITTTSLPNGTVGTAYSATLTATGGTPPYTWSLVNGTLPAGLTLSSSGTISGTPSAAATYTFTVQAKDSASTPQAASQSFSITTSSSTTILWHADHETGDLTQWYYPSTSKTGDYGGGEYDSGTAVTTASTAAAHTGSWGAKMTITAPPKAGTRMFRWRESRANRGAYYSVWIYIPQVYTLTADPSTGHFVNLIQIKTRTSDNTRNDPVWAFYVDDSHPGQWYIKAGFDWGNTQLAGPYAGGSIGGKWYYQTLAPLPIGKWTHLEVYLYESNAYNGRVTFWQDGAKLFDFQNVITSYNNCNYNTWCAANEWAVNMYSDGLSPSPSWIYMDDASIGTGYIP